MATLRPLEHLASVKESDSSSRHERDEAVKDYFSILSIGPPLEYVIPGFDVLAVQLRPIRIQGETPEGDPKVYDVLIRDDPSLNRSYPTPLEVEEYTNIQVTEIPS